MENVVVMPYYDFQAKGKDATMMMADSSFFHQVDEKGQIQYGNNSYELTLTDLMPVNRINVYGFNGEKVIFIHESLFNEDEAFFKGKYLLNISELSQYGYVKDRIERMDGQYLVQNSYQHVSELITSIEMNQIFIYTAAVVINVITLILMTYVQYNEAKDKRKELSLFQANGLSKQGVLVIEGAELVMKVLDLSLLSGGVIFVMIQLMNHFLLSLFKISFDQQFVLMLLALHMIDVIIPAFISLFYLVHTDIKKELRANVM